MDGNYSLSDIAAVSGRNNDGMFGGDWSAWIILFLLFGLFGNGRGFGGFGGGNGGSCGCEPCATKSDLTAQGIVQKLDGITYGISDGVYAVTYSDNTVITVDYNKNTYEVTKA